MIEINQNSDNLIEVTIEGSVSTEDFDNLELQADELIKQHGTIRLLINASNFNGWKNMALQRSIFLLSKVIMKKWSA